MTYQKALILAGGQGTRLRRLGELIPKCLVPLYDQPLLIRQIELCQLAGVTEVVVNISTLYERVLTTVLEHYRPRDGLVIRCAVESSPLGPIRALTSFSEELGSSNLIVLLGDEYYEHSGPFEALAKGIAHDMVVGVVQTESRRRIDCNVALNTDGEVSSIKDKPLPSQIEGSLRWCGMVALRSGLLPQAASLVEQGELQGKHIGDLLEALRAKGVSTAALMFPEVHLNLNSVDDVLLAGLLEARKNWSRERSTDLAKLDAAILSLKQALL